MQLQVTTKEGRKYLNDVVIGELILCEDGQYYPIKNILITSCYPIFARLSNGISFYASIRMNIKTNKGFKTPELWDVIEISKDLTPQIVNLRNIDRIMFFHDILVDGNIITPDGLVFSYKS